MMTYEAERVLTVAPSPAFWVAVGLYTLATAVTLGALAGRAKWDRPALVVAVVAFVAHAVDIGWRGTLHVHPAQSVREALGFLAWILSGGYLIASVRYRLNLAGVVVLPIAMMLLIAARLSPAGSPDIELGVLGRVHIVLATVGVGVFALASALAGIYLLEERSLKKKQFDAIAFTSKGAPLESLDRLTHRLVWVGFPVFTIAMVLGVVWNARRGDAWHRPEHLVALVTWLVFGALIVTRTAYGWRGRRSARLTLIGFAAALVVLAIYLVRRAVS
jgi:ABC-type uncharacterized transport system permease subunit